MSIPFGGELPTPEERWLRVMARLNEALTAAPIMKSAPRADDRDRATRDYVQAADALIAEMGALADAGQLQGVADFLRVSFGRV